MKAVIFKCINHRYRWLLFSTLVIPFDAMSTIDPPKIGDWIHPVIVVSSGISSAQIGDKQSLRTSGNLSTYSYAPQDNRSSAFMGSIFLGTQNTVGKLFSMQFGIEYSETQRFNGLQGTFSQGVDPQSSDEYNYDYRVKHRMLSVVAKFASNAQKSYHPYLLLSLGVSANKAYHYQTTVPPFITFTPIYASQKNTSLSYSIGGGVDADINKKWRFGVGYRYADLGKANLGAATIDTTAFPPPLKQSHLKAHQFVAQLTYFFAKDS